MGTAARLPKQLGRFKLYEQQLPIPCEAQVDRTCLRYRMHLLVREHTFGHSKRTHSSKKDVVQGGVDFFKCSAWLIALQRLGNLAGSPQ